MADLKISELTDYTSAVDADILPIVDTTLSTTKKISWANIKATLKTYFDGIYTAAGGANSALSNLANVQLATNLIFADKEGGVEGMYNVSIDKQSITNIAGNSLGIFAGEGNGTGNGGELFLAAGSAEDGTGQANGGSVWVEAGDAAGTNKNGGDVYLQPGAGTGSGVNGYVWITNAANAYSALLDVSLIAGSDKTFTFPNATGTLALLDSPVFTTKIETPTIELGHASDTTLARVSAGVVSVEGARVITSTGTTSGTILKNNGTTFVASTETYAAPGTSGNVMTSDGTNWTSAAPAASGAFWTAVAGSPTRASNTTFTVTGDYTALFKKGMVLKWTESSTVRNAMISIPSTYSSPNTTVTIVGDTMASIDANSLKYAMVGAENFIARFAVAGTLGSTGTDIANAYYATEPMRVLAADLQVGTVASTSGTTTIDINKGGTTMFTTKATLAYNAATSATPFTADSATSLALADKVTIDIDGVTSTTFPVDLYLQLYLFPTRLNNLT